MECALCGDDVCCHGSINIRFDGIAGSFRSKCTDCGAIGVNEQPPVYCLPTHEGVVDWGSTVFSTVCPSCHNESIHKINQW